MTNLSLQISDTSPNMFYTNSFHHPNELVIIFILVDMALPSVLLSKYVHKNFCYCMLYTDIY